MWRIYILVVIVFGGCGGGSDGDGDILSPIILTPLNITPSIETSPAIYNGAKIPVIWNHPTDTALSAIIGANQSGGGIEVYDLQGNQVVIVPVGKISGVDLRYNFPLNGEQVTLIAASNRSNDTLGLYTIDPDTLQLTNVAARAIWQDIWVDVLCMYHSVDDGKYYVIVMDGDEGVVQQWELFATGDGTVDARLRRHFELNRKVSGCVADDQYAHLYVAEAGNTISKYGAEPQDGMTGVQLDTDTSMISCLSLYYAQGKTGYIIVGTADDNNFLVYQRGNDNTLLGNFTIAAGNEIDGVSKTEGMAVTNVALNQTFSQGLLVVQDAANTEPAASTNYKFVPWEQVANTLNLVTDTTVNPRQIGSKTKIDAIKTVQATVETEPVSVTGDAADDMAIWVHPNDPALSTIIGTQKQGGLLVYDLTGKQIQYLQDGKMNNVDLRSRFPLGNEMVSLVAVTNRTNSSIAFYKVNPVSRQLENIAVRTVTVGLRREAYGLCMYHDQSSKKFYVFVNDKSGMVEQWEVFADQSEKVNARLVRSFEVGSQTEGCVVDDQSASLYIGEENVGIWKYSANPEGNEIRTPVDTTGKNGHLMADVEGLTIYNGGQNSGYLIASSQGNDTFTLYNRTGNNEYLGTFQIITNNTLNIDGVSDTDGIDVVNVPLGTAFPYGVFVVQDGWNNKPAENQNFKLVPWENIADAFELVKNVD
jgi:3-phytase